MKTYIEPSENKLEKIVSRELELSSTILHYTGHMYGIGCRISQEDSIKRIYQLKKKTDNSGFIALVPDLEWFKDNDIILPERLIPILEQFWPGNLTIVISSSLALFKHIEFNGKVAFRVPTDDMLRAFTDILGEPLLSTSINISRLPAESDFDRIKKNYETWFDYAIIPNPKRINSLGEASTIIEYIASGEKGNLHPELKCIREGSIPFYQIKKAFELPLVNFVCTANICRSPIAEYLFNHNIKASDMRYIGDSSGLLESGNMISVNSLQLLLANGISEAQVHISQQINPQIINESWLILTMEERQRDFLHNKAPESKHKIFTLNEIVGESGDVEDPYGSDLDSYKITYDIIEDRIKRLIKLIQEKKIYTRKNND